MTAHIDPEIEACLHEVLTSAQQTARKIAQHPSACGHDHLNQAFDEDSAEWQRRLIEAGVSDLTEASVVAVLLYDWIADMAIRAQHDHGLPLVVANSYALGEAGHTVAREYFASKTLSGLEALLADSPPPRTFVAGAEGTEVQELLGETEKEQDGE